MSSSITQVLRTTTWLYFTQYLPQCFIRSPTVVKEVIKTDMNDLMQEFMTSSDASGAVRAMCRLLEFLEVCFNFLEMCFDTFSAFASAST